MNKNFIQFIKYVFYGVIAALINTLLYALFTRVFDFSTVISTAIAWLLANVFAFFCNQIFVFPGANKKFLQLILALLYTILLKKHLMMLKYTLNLGILRIKKNIFIQKIH